MTKDLEREVKTDFFRESKECAANRMRGMGADPGPYEPDSWEGMMTMLEDVFGSKAKAAAVLAAAKWAWGHLECEEERLVKKMEDAIEHETSAASAASAAKPEKA